MELNSSNRTVREHVMREILTLSDDECDQLLKEIRQIKKEVRDNEQKAN